MSKTRQPNLNNQRSQATRSRLIRATISSLVDAGYTRTTGVEICRRAGVTRGALNHHFPDFVELLIAALREVYAQLQESGTVDASLSAIVESGYRKVIQPEFKAVIELWLASRNDPETGGALSQAIAESANLFSPQQVLGPHTDKQLDAWYYMAFETLIGIGLGRATNGGQPSNHESQVMDTLLRLTRQAEGKERKS